MRTQSGHDADRAPAGGSDEGLAVKAPPVTLPKGGGAIRGLGEEFAATILDNFAQGVTRNTFSTMNLYLNGPEDPKLTKAAVKLLNANTDRTKNPPPLH